MFDQRQLGSGIQLSKMYLIHKGSHEEDAAPRAAQQVFWSQRIRKGIRVQPLALVGDDDHQRRAVVLKAGEYLLGEVDIRCRAERRSLQPSRAATATWKHSSSSRPASEASFSATASISSTLSTADFSVRLSRPAFASLTGLVSVFSGTHPEANRPPCAAD